MPGIAACTTCFNTQPPEGGWRADSEEERRAQVSTHSRLKAAGTSKKLTLNRAMVSTHSRLKAAGSCSWADEEVG